MGLNINAIFVAMVIGFLLDIFSGLTLGVLLGGTSREATSSTEFLIGSLILGTLSTSVSGYIAARMAKIVPYLNSAAIGVICIILGIFFAGNNALWFNVLGFASAIPAALLGGHLAKMHMQEMQNEN